MRLTALIFICAGFTYSLVDFTNSALYDIYDFKGVNEVSLPKCDHGCLIFAATKGEGFIQETNGLDPYANNLYIYDGNEAKSSIAKIATQRDANLRKIPLVIDGQQKVVVRNQNEDDAKDVTQSIVFYVVKKHEAAQFSYEVYDTYYSRATNITPSAEIVTILSAQFFGVQAAPTRQVNFVTVRLVGFENAADDNVDGCPYAYKASDSTPFPGFFLQSSTPIMSLVVGTSSSIQIQTSTQFNTVRDIGYDGFITSPGWNGCPKRFQSFRTPDDAPTDSYMLTNNDDLFQVSMTVLPNFDAKHSLTVANMKSAEEPTVITGKDPQLLSFARTNYLLLDFNDMKGDQGFLVRYSTTPIPKTTTVGPISSTTTTTATTPSTEQPTTSSACEITGIMMPILLLSLLR